jgi:pimeloyl-ACP methyl ester carboxylesterase
MAYREKTQQSRDGLGLYARLYPGPAGDAPTVLCLHGLTRNSRDFEDLAPHLARRYQVIVPDLRGRGRSDRDPDPRNYNPAVYLTDLVALLDESGVKPAVIGTSLGGMLAMMLAVTQRARIAGIVLNDIGPEIDPTGIERIKGYAGRTPPARDWEEAAAQTRTIYGQAWPDLPPERWAALTRRGCREHGGHIEVDADPAIGEVMRAAPAAAPDLWPLWNALADMPALAIRGALSDILSAATFERMKSAKPDLHVLTVANRGHVPLLDEPECLAAIDGFLTRVLRPGV